MCSGIDTAMILDAAGVTLVLALAGLVGWAWRRRQP